MYCAPYLKRLSDKKIARATKAFFIFCKFVCYNKRNLLFLKGFRDFYDGIYRICAA